MSDSQLDDTQTTRSSQTSAPAEFNAIVRQIRELWARQREHWDGNRVAEIHRQLHDLATAAEAQGLRALSETAFNAEVYLSSFVGMETPMSPSQRETFDALLGELPMDSAPSPRDDGAPLSAKAIQALGDVQGPVGQLVDALRAGGLSVQHLTDPSEAARHLVTTPPAALIADLADIPLLEPVIETLARIRRENNRHVPLVYVASTGDLETRVKAVRAGGDAIYSPPFDSTQITERLRSLIEQHTGHDTNRVLIVEDDAAQAEFAASILAKAGMETATVTDPMAILERLREFRPDLILMDIYMPEVNGIELTTVIRGYDEFVDIPVVFLSGEQDSDKQVDALSVGADDFLTKPIRPRQLIAVVENRLRRSQRRGRTGRGRELGARTLDRTRFTERLGALLATGPMHTRAMAVMLLTPDLEAGVELDTEARRCLLDQIAQSLADELSPEDSIAVFDEHAIAVIAARSTKNLVHDLASRLREKVTGQTFGASLHGQSLTVSIGIAFADGVRTDPASLINRARVAQQRAREQGPGKTVVYDEELEPTRGHGTVDEANEDDLAKTIRRCLEKDGFVVLYQPMLDLVERGMETWDVQVRLPTPAGELLTRRDFRKQAEQAGLTLEVDHWTLERALDILKRRSEGNRHTLRLFVAQSGEAIIHPEYAEWLSASLRERRMVGTGLVLEFDLSSVSRDLKAAKGNLRKLREMDVQASLSRFPDKTAAFKVLRYLRCRFVRVAPPLLTADHETIDRFISEVHELSTKVIVSGIDDPRAIDLHWSSGADLLQGDFIQHPLETMDYDFSQVII
ncbi:MAG: response regulator [Gammaproteobacteria bacterium]|nr:MAG: response regulator [Gammaproteobacteria bacterium]